MTLATVAGTINNFTNRAGAILPQFAVNSSTSRYFSVFSKAVTCSLLFYLLEAALYSLYLYSSVPTNEVHKENKSDAVKVAIFRIAKIVVMLAALRFNPYFGSFLVFGTNCWHNASTAPPLSKWVGMHTLWWLNLSIKNCSGLAYLFNSSPSFLTLHVTTTALKNFKYIKNLFKRDKLTRWNLCMVAVPIAVDLACIGVGIRILLNK